MMGAWPSGGPANSEPGSRQWEENNEKKDGTKKRWTSETKTINDKSVYLNFGSRKRNRCGINEDFRLIWGYEKRAR